MKAGADGPAWSAAVAGALGGKAGGKGATSVGNGTNPDKADEGVEIARQWIENFSI